MLLSQSISQANCVLCSGSELVRCTQRGISQVILRRREEHHYRRLEFKRGVSVFVLPQPLRIMHLVFTHSFFQCLLCVTHWVVFNRDTPASQSLL